MSTLFKERKLFKELLATQNDEAEQETTIVCTELPQMQICPK